MGSGQEVRSAGRLSIGVGCLTPRGWLGRAKGQVEGVVGRVRDGIAGGRGAHARVGAKRRSAQLLGVPNGYRLGM